jgi:hypothetical protein
MRLPHGNVVVASVKMPRVYRATEGDYGEYHLAVDGDLTLNENPCKTHLNL